MPRKNKTKKYRKNKKSKKTGGGIEFSKHKLAIIMPYRDRINHLETITKYLNVYLDLQKINYDIFVIDQNDNKPFNRAKLLNVGFDISSKLGTYDYFITHDIDELPINSDYSYNDTPISLLGHFPNKWDQKNYGSHDTMHDSRLTVSKNNMGGVVLFTEDNFRKLNGYSNSFIGWGGEDDDFASRVKHIFHSIKRRPGIYARLPHKKVNLSDEFRNEPNPNYQHNKKLLENSVENMFKDGLNTLSYSIDSKEDNKFYKLFKVNI